MFICKIAGVFHGWSGEGGGVGGERERWVRRVRGEGCWFMTMGYVYYQEPDRVVSQICYSSVQDFGKKRLLRRGSEGEGS